MFSRSLNIMLMEWQCSKKVLRNWLFLSLFKLGYFCLYVLDTCSHQLFCMQDFLGLQWSEFSVKVFCLFLTVTHRAATLDTELFRSWLTLSVTTFDIKLQSCFPDCGLLPVPFLLALALVFMQLLRSTFDGEFSMLK